MIVAASGALLCTSLAQAGPAPAAGLLQEYVDWMVQTEYGYVTFAELDLPHDYLVRAAGRSVRLDYRQRFRQVVADQAAADPLPGRSAPPAALNFAGEAVPPSTVDSWKMLSGAVPGLRGFRAPVPAGSAVDEAWPMGAAQPGVGTYTARRAAAEFVAAHLAREGLVRTTMQVMRRIDLPWTGETALDPAALRAAGIPTDLLAFYRAGEEPVSDAIAAWYGDGAAEESIEPVARLARLVYEPSCPGFIGAPEDGSRPVAALRFQIPSDALKANPGDGGALDAFRQVLEAVPQCAAWVSARDADAPGLGQLLGDAGGPFSRATFALTPMPVTCWAQDNAKVGWAPAAEDAARRRLVTLIPRYASRNEQADKFVPGDSLLFSTLRPVVGQIVQSPLSFQGGNLLPVQDPRTGRSLLLIGEREVYRNQALGLSRQEVLEAFRVEFGVDECVVVPAVSIHLDMEFTVRQKGQALVACVIDEVAASRIVVAEGVKALRRGGALGPQQQDVLLARLQHNEIRPLADGVEQVLAPYRDVQGRLGSEAAAMFGGAPSASESAAALRFLVALDILVAHALSEQLLALVDVNLKRYLQSFRLRAAERSQLAEQLRRLGMEVRPVPGLSDEEAGIHYINGLHTPSGYLMPAFGAPYQALDDAAAEAFRRAFGDGVQIRAIRTAALQRSFGALHCAVSLYPAPP